MTEPGSPSPRLDKIRDAAHRFHAAHQHDFRSAQQNLFVTQCDGLQPRGARLIYGVSGHFHRNAGAHGDLTGWVRAIAGLTGVPGESWYSATKAGLACLADSLRAELRPNGIGVTLVSPGVVDTPFFERRKVPYQRVHPQLMSAQKAAEAIVTAVEHGRDDLVIPQWLSFPARLKVSFPSLYRLLAARFA